MKEQNRCWKQIGVWGKDEPTCPELQEVIHCRNCEVFTRAGRNLLERELPEDYQDQWGQVLLAKKEEEPEGSIPVVIFRVEGEWMAIPARLFAEITEMRKPHTLPHRKSPVLMGVVNVHGEVHLCISLKQLMGLEEQEGKEAQGGRSRERMMVVNKDGDFWVFPVREVHGIQHLHPSMFQNVPVTVSKSRSAFTRAIFRWQNRHVALLDDELLFYSLKKSIA